MNTLTTIFAAGAFALTASAASAVSVDYDDWGTSGTCEISDISPEAADCFGMINATNDVVNGKQMIGKVNVNLDKFDGTMGLFGKTDWIFEAKIGYDVSGQEATFGLLSSLVSGYEQIAHGFKHGAGGGGSELAYYLYNTPFPEVSAYSLMKFTNPGLSHLTVWGRGVCLDEDGCGGGDTGTVVPLPAAGWLLLGGLGGLAALRRRNKTA